MTSRTTTTRWLAVALIGALAQMPALGQEAVDTEGNAVDAARGALQEWVEVRARIADEKAKWAVGKEVLEDRIDVLRSEIENFRARIDEAQKSIAAADEELEELRADSERLNAASQTVKDRIVGYEERTKAMLEWMPPPVLEKVEMIRQRFPKDPETTKQPLSGRFVTIAGVLNEINKFNAEITAVPERRELPGGQAAEVTTIYLGLGQAYYVSVDGLSAGVGLPAEGEWQWTAKNDAAAEVALAADVLSGAQLATFVRLPLSVQ